MTDHSSLLKEKNNFDIVERLQKERRPTAWTRGIDTDYPTAWEPNLLCHEAAAEITRLREDNKKLSDKAEELRSVMIAAAEEIQAHWPAHCDAEGYGPANLMRRLEEGIPSQYAYTAGDFVRLRAEAEALRKDAERLDWISASADRGRIEIARSIFGGGYEIGQLPDMRATAKIGTVRDVIDAAIAATTKEQKA